LVTLVPVEWSERAGDTKKPASHFESIKFAQVRKMVLLIDALQFKDLEFCDTHSNFFGIKTHLKTKLYVAQFVTDF